MIEADAITSILNPENYGERVGSCKRVSADNHFFTTIYTRCTVYKGEHSKDHDEKKTFMTIVMNCLRAEQCELNAPRYRNKEFKVKQNKNKRDTMGNE